MENKYFNTQSPGFSDFRGLMDTWDNFCVLQEQRDKISDLLDRHELSLFFKKGEDYFGAPETSRIIFAKLKNDDDEDFTPDLRDQAKFLALNLLKAMAGSDEPSETLFGSTDLPTISVCDREEAIDKILNHKPDTSKEKSKEKDE